MTTLPTGTVTLLLGDVEDSTMLWKGRPDDMRTAVAGLDEVIAKTVAAHDGARPVEQGEGDSFVAAFARASDAVACALALQRATSDGFLRLRMGLHTGEVELRDAHNYMGRTINRAARIRDAGHGGQVLLTQAAAEVARDSLPEAVSLRDLGALELRGFDGAERIWQLDHPELRSDFSPLRVPGGGSTNLPVQLTSFIGRSREVEEVNALVAASRAVTVTGVGGCGKTRLAVEVAARRLGDHAEGVWFAELGRYNEAQPALTAVAAAVGLRRASAVTADGIVRFVGGGSMLLVLDNCEHLLNFAAELTDALLRGCPGLKVLATSREPVGVAGEVTYRVPSLAVPAGDSAVDVLQTFGAVDLFVERARRARPDFRLDATNAPPIVEICRRLDGLPLAIELAAARLRVLTPEQVLDGLQHRFRLLTGGTRTAVPRQQTLQASVDWSYSLLLDVERDVLDRLSLFAGGFTLAAAEAVCAGDGFAGHHVLDIVLQLVDKSLVIANGDRFSLLETVRQYAAARLADAGDASAGRARHYDFFVEVARLHPPAGDTEDSYRERITNDGENLRRALQWAADQDEPAVLARLASRLFLYWAAGNSSEGVPWFETVIMREDHIARRAKAMGRLAWLLHRSDADPDRARRLTEEGVALARQADDKGTLAEVLTWAAAVRPTEASADEAIALTDELGHPLAVMARWARGLWTIAFDPAASGTYWEEGLALALSTGQVGMARIFEFGLVTRRVMMGELKTVLPALDAATTSFRDAGDVLALRALLSFTGIVREMTGDRRGGDAALAEARRLEADVITQLPEAFVLAGTAFVAARRGDWEGSIRGLRRVTELPLAPEHRAAWLATLAVLAALAGRNSDAVAHCDEARQLSAADGWIPMVGLYPNDDLPRAIATRAACDLPLAEDLAHRAVDDVRVRPRPVWVTTLVVGVLASIVARRGRPEDATRLFAGIRAEAARVGFVADSAVAAAAEDGELEACRQALGSERFEVLWTEGAAMSWNEVLDYAQRGWGPRDRPVFGREALTPTERQVADLVAAGATNKEVAEKLFMSVATVKTHLTRVYAKVGVSSRSQLAAQERV